LDHVASSARLRARDRSGCSPVSHSTLITAHMARTYAVMSRLGAGRPVSVHAPNDHLRSRSNRSTRITSRFERLGQPLEDALRHRRRPATASPHAHRRKTHPMPRDSGSAPRAHRLSPREVLYSARPPPPHQCASTDCSSIPAASPPTSLMRQMSHFLPLCLGW